VKRASLVCALALVALVACDDAPPKRTPERPNVLIILTDDQREGLEVMPSTRKWFAEEGRSYPSAWVTTPLCCPARASVMTGRYAHNHRVLTNDFGAAQQLDQKTTLQYRLQQAGYTTGIFGKYLNKWDPEVRPPYFDSNMTYSFGAPFTEGEWNHNGEVVRLEAYWTEVLGDAVFSFLDSAESRDERPWFALITPPAPHIPAIPEDKYADAPVPRWAGNPAVFDDRSDQPPYLQRAKVTFERGKEVRALQYRALMSVDDLVERLMTELEQTGELENTLAFFVSDNGFSWGEFGYLEKSLPYRFVVQVPFLMRGPGIEAGSVDDRDVTHVDIAPTILEVAGIEGGDLDGRSLLDPGWERDRLLLEYFKTKRFTPPTWQSLRTDEYQYIRYLDPGGTVTFEEFYDLAADPWQTVNLLADDDPATPGAGLLAEIEAQLDADLACRGRACP
jgi:arylsulfatase A-like enzyme